MTNDPPGNLEKRLRTARFDLEPIGDAHADALFDGLQATALYTYIPEDPPPSVAWLEARYRRWARRGNESGNEVWLNYAIFDRASATYVGTLQATITGPERGLLAYLVFPEYWRRGIAKEACGGLIAFLAQDFPLMTLAAHVDTRNVASGGLLRSLGFKLVATIQAADTFKGAVSDEFVYELPLGERLR